MSAPTTVKAAEPAADRAAFEAAIQQAVRAGMEAGMEAANNAWEEQLPTFLAQTVEAARRINAPNLTERLQQKCSDWNTYWRASDAHGVNLSHAQAVELLQDALGVEVEVAVPPVAVTTAPLTNLQTWLTCKLIGSAATPEAETVKTWIAALARLTGEAVPPFATPANTRCKFASGGARCVTHCGDPICLDGSDQSGGHP
jgi:hypothetical protein